MNKTLTNGTHEFELVDFIPYGYKIWNIGKNMTDGYLPLVITGGYNGCQVIGTKKAIKCEEAQTILSVIGFGQNNIKNMQEYIKEHKNSNDVWEIMHVERVEKALKILHTVKGSENLRQ
jgi:hypothetical protein